MSSPKKRLLFHTNHLIDLLENLKEILNDDDFDLDLLLDSIDESECQAQAQVYFMIKCYNEIIKNEV